MFNCFNVWYLKRCYSYDKWSKITGKKRGETSATQRGLTDFLLSSLSLWNENQNLRVKRYLRGKSLMRGRRRKLETAGSGSARCIPLSRVPLRSQQPPSSSTLARLPAPYLVHGNNARVPGPARRRRRRRGGSGGGVKEKKKTKRKGMETKEDQRRTDRARINCRNTGSSLSTGRAPRTDSSLWESVLNATMRFVCSFSWCTYVDIGGVVPSAKQDTTRPDLSVNRRVEKLLIRR